MPNFTIIDIQTEVRIDSITRLNDGSGKVKIDFSIKDDNYEKVSIRFDYTIDDGDTWHPCKITQVSDGQISLEEDYITDLLATTSWVSYYAYFQYSGDNEIQLVTDSLKTKDLKISSQVIINRGGTDYDISRISGDYNITRNKRLGSSQATINIADKEFKYNPINENSEINQVGGNYEPLLYFGNSVKIFQKLLTSQGIKTYQKFEGKIKNTAIEKDSASNKLSIYALDVMQKLIDYRPNDLIYEATKQEIIQETLRTFDGVTYYSEHSSWAEYPAPIIYLNDEQEDADKYIIDFVRGQVIYKGNVLSKLKTSTQECTNPLGDRKTWETGIEFDNSILPTVYYNYEKYEQFDCNDYTGYTYQWTGYVEELTENDDYYIDYETGTIYLYDALSIDAPAEVIGNRKNQTIVIIFREATILKTTYSYEVEGTNEVEDIIKDLAIKAGISSSDMQDNISTENLILRDDKYLFTIYSNLISLTLYRNALAMDANDYDLDERNGIITLEEKDYDSKNRIIEDCDYLWDSVSGGVTQSTDTSDYQEGTGSLKVIYPVGGGEVFRNLIGDLHNYTVTNQRYIEFYVKGNIAGTAQLKISPDNINWESKTISITTSWQKIIWDINGIAEIYKEIKYLKLVTSEEIILWIDNIYVKRNIYTTSYFYYTLQATGITLSKAEFNYENTENAFQGIQELLKNVAPNYIIYVDDEGKLVSYYSEQRLLRNNVTGWNNYSRGLRAYSRSYYGEHYIIKLPKRLMINISDEEVYTGVIVIGKNNEPENVAIKGTMADVCSWVAGKSYLQKTTATENASYPSDALPMGLGDNIVFYDMANQDQDPITGGAGAMNDFDTYTGMHWYAANDAPDPNTLMAELTLLKTVKWDRIDILVGSYDGKVIKEGIVIKVGDEFGNYWYTERNMLRIEPGATGSWVTFENNFNENIAIKYVQIYCAEPWSWSVTTTTSGGKKGGASSRTDYHYVFSIAEIQVWERPTLIAEARLDNCLLVGDGVTTQVQIPNTPFKTKDYLEARWGWVEKYPEQIILYKNSLGNQLTDGADYIYDNTTGIVTFSVAPIVGDVICGTWTLDERHPDETTHYASFSNIEILKRIGLRFYKEVDEGLYTHLKTIDRAHLILPELQRSIYPSSLEIVYRPDMKLGQSILIVNEELSLSRIFYIDEITTGMSGHNPMCNIGLTSFLELKDYEYQEQNPDIYRDFMIYYPQYLTAWADYNYGCHSEADGDLHQNVGYYTGLIAIDALDDNGNVQEDYNQECKLEILSLDGSTTFKLVENTVKSEMWENGKAELNFYIQWNQDGGVDSMGRNLPTTPSELQSYEKWYCNRNIQFKFYEINNPVKFKIFTCRIKLYLVGSIMHNYLQEIGNIGMIYPYINAWIDNSFIIGKSLANDIYDVFKNTQTYQSAIVSIYSYGQSLFRIWRINNNYCKAQQYNFGTDTWTDWGGQFAVNWYVYPPAPRILNVFAGKLLIRNQWGSNYEAFLWDGKSKINILPNTAMWLNVVWNNKLYFTQWALFYTPNQETYEYSADGTYVKYTQPRIISANFLTTMIVFKNKIYTTHAYISAGTISNWDVHVWNDDTKKWEEIYKYTNTTKEEPVPREAFIYFNKLYFVMARGYWTQPFLAEFDIEDNQIYNKGFLVNKDWGYYGSRAIPSSKLNNPTVVQFQGNIYLLTTIDAAASSDRCLIKNITPLVSNSKRELIFKNEL